VSEAIGLEGVTKSFGSKVAVRDLDLVVREGGLYGYIGPNGAGKTTTIRMIMSILLPDTGRISVLGHGSALEAKDRIGYLPEERGLYKKMRVGSFLRYVGRLKGCAGPGLQDKVRSWLERLDLGGVENKRCEELSKGMQQKVQFASAVLHEPDLLILDEPFSGLDPVNMRLLRELIREQHRRGATVIFSTHVMVQAEQLCDHILMIDDGRKVLDDSLEAIRRRHDPRIVLFEALDPRADLAPLRRVDGVQDLVRTDGTWEIHLREGTDVARAMRDVLDAVPASRLELHRPTLEDVFVQIVTRARGGTALDARALRTTLREEPRPAEGAPRAGKGCGTSRCASFSRRSGPRGSSSACCSPR
jgi:ABC-2 type transport system ATP-binding protein